MIVSKEQVEMIRTLTKAIEEYGDAREELGAEQAFDEIRDTVHTLLDCIADAYNALLRDETEEAICILGEIIHIDSPDENEYDEESE